MLFKLYVVDIIGQFYSIFIIRMQLMMACFIHMISVSIRADLPQNILIIRVYGFKDIVYLGSVTLYYMDYFKPPPPPIFHSTIYEI
jgi:hypothetical protein